MATFGKREQRTRFLVRLYEVTDGNRFAAGNVEELGKELGLTPEETDTVIQYLEGRGWIEWRAMGLISITHYGVEEAERLLAEKPEDRGSGVTLANPLSGVVMERPEWSPLDPAIPLVEQDALTGLGDRGAFDKDLQRFVESSKAQKMPLACLMIDVNDFKQVNDTYGHPAGDATLRALAATIRSVIYGKGRAYRYGGDEFVALLFNFTTPDARGVGDRLREEAASLNVQGLSQSVGLTVGIAIYPESATDAAELVQRADDALREGKQGGKDLTIVYSALDAGPRSSAKPTATPEEIDQIIEWFESGDSVVRADAAKELQRLVWQKLVFHHEPIRAAIRRLLKDPGEQVRIEALEIVRELIVTNKDAVGRYYFTPLVNVAEHDPSLQVRARVMAIIGVSGDSGYLEHVYGWIGTWDEQTYSSVRPITALTGLTLSGLGERIRNDLRALIDRAAEPARSRYVEALKNVVDAIR